MKAGVELCYRFSNTFISVIGGQSIAVIMVQGSRTRNKQRVPLIIRALALTRLQNGELIFDDNNLQTNHRGAWIDR
jgi:hypothetical protein